MNNISTFEIVDLQKFTRLEDSEKLRLAYEYIPNATKKWFGDIASDLSIPTKKVSPSTIENHYYGKIQRSFAPKEIEYLYNRAVQRIVSQKDPRQLSLLEGVNG